MIARNPNSYRRNGLRGPARLVAGGFSLLVLVVVLGGCLNPFATDSSGSSRSGDTAQYHKNTGGLRVTIGDEGLSAATILPGLLTEAIVTYDVELTNHSGGAADRSEFVSPADLPYTIGSIQTGTWDLTVHALNNSAETVGTFTQAGITITEGETTNVSVVIRGTQNGTGRLEYTITWPAGEADDVSVTIIPDSYGNEQIPITGAEEHPGDLFTTLVNEIGTSGDTSQLDLILDPIASGTYFLEITFIREGGQNAPVIEAAQVYDNRTSSKTVNLSPGALTQPPAAPSGLAAHLTGNGALTLTWTDEANTETGYRVLQNGEEIASLDPNAVSHPVENLAAGSPFSFEVAAFNDFGESSSSITVTPISIGTVSFVTTASANRASWVHRSAPGTISTSVDGASGTNSVTVHIDSDFSAVESLAASEQVPYTPTGAFLNLSHVLSGNTYSEGQTYYYRVEATNGSTSGSVVSEIQEFTIRDGNLFVSATTNTPAGAFNAAASQTAPISTISGAVTIAQPGEVIRVAVGSYSGAVNMSGENDKSLTLEGGYSEDFASRVPAADIATLNPGVNVTTVNSVLQVFNHTSSAGNSVVIDGFHIRGGNSAVEFGGNSVATLTGSVLENGGGNLENVNNFLTNVLVSTSGVVSITGNSFDMAPTGLANATGITSQSIFVNASGNQVLIEDNGFFASMSVRDYTAVRGNASLTRSYVVSSNTIGYAEATGPSSGSALISLQSGSIEFTDNDVTMARGDETWAVRAVRFASDGALTLSRNSFFLDGTLVSEPTITAVDLISDSNELSRIDNNVFHADSYQGNFRAIQLNNNRELNIDHNTMVLTGAVAPTDWSLFHVNSGGTSPVQIRNNIAQGIDSQTGRPVNTSVASTIVHNNLFYNFMGIRVGNTTWQTVDALNNNVASAENNIELDAQLDGSFGLTANSPIQAREGAIDLTGDPDFITYDRNNSQRVGQISMGAFQY